MKVIEAPCGDFSPHVHLPFGSPYSKTDLSAIIHQSSLGDAVGYRGGRY